jgi:hypothetical protein
MKILEVKKLDLIIIVALLILSILINAWLRGYSKRYDIVYKGGLEKQIGSSVLKNLLCLEILLFFHSFLTFFSHI